MTEGRRAATDAVARDGEEFTFQNAGQHWTISYHPATLPVPDGRNHGSTAFCFTPEGRMVLVSKDGRAWEPPAGRPEADEGWRETLDREVMEEACARVEDGVLLGYSKGLCTYGHEAGLVLIRSLWWARVALLPWEPQDVMTYRLQLRPADVMSRIAIAPLVPTFGETEMSAGLAAIFRRFLKDALAIEMARFP